MFNTVVCCMMRARSARVLVFLGVACAMAGAALIPVAHASPSHAPVTITMWAPFSGPDGAEFKTLVANFNASQSAVKVDYNTESETNYDPTLKTAVANGKAPDVFVDNGNDVLATYADAGKLTPLEKSLGKYKSLSSKNYAKAIWNGGVYKGHVYGVPVDVLPLTMYYNKAVFSKFKLNPNKPPTDLSSFLADAKKMTKGSTYGFVVPPAWPEQFFFPTMLAQFGGKEMNTSAKKSTVNSSAGVKALSLLRDFVFKYKISPKNAAQDQDLRMLPTGTAGMIVDGPWQYTNLHNAMGSKLGVAAVPKWGTKRAVFLGTAYFSVYSGSASSAKTNAALKFFDYFETHSLSWAKTGDLPAYIPVLKSKGFKALSFEKTISSMLPYGVVSPEFPGYGPSYAHYIYDAIEPVLRGQKSDVKGALNTAANNINNAIQGSSG